MSLLRTGVGRPIDAAAAFTGTNTWNPSDKSTNFTLSNGNLTASDSNTTNYRGVRATNSKASGKIYWEVKIDAASGSDVAGDGVGMASSNMLLDGDYPGSGATGIDSVGWFGNGRFIFNGVNNFVVESWAQGDTLCFALDLDNKKIWGRKNGGNWNNDVIGNQNPATNTGGLDISTLTHSPWYAAMGILATNATFTATANFGGSAYAQTPPSGFGNW